MGASSGKPFQSHWEAPQSIVGPVHSGHVGQPGHDDCLGDSCVDPCGDTGFDPAPDRSARGFSAWSVGGGRGSTKSNRVAGGSAIGCSPSADPSHAIVITAQTTAVPSRSLHRRPRLDRVQPVVTSIDRMNCTIRRLRTATVAMLPATPCLRPTHSHRQSPPLWNQTWPEQRFMRVVPPIHGEPMKTGEPAATEQSAGASQPVRSGISGWGIGTPLSGAPNPPVAVEVTADACLELVNHGGIDGGPADQATRRVQNP